MGRPISNASCCMRVVRAWIISSAAVLVAAAPGRARTRRRTDGLRTAARAWRWAPLGLQDLMAASARYPGQAGKPKDRTPLEEAPSVTRESAVLDQPDVEARPPAPAARKPGVVEQAEVDASRPDPTLEPPAASAAPEIISAEPDINKVMPEEWRAAAADQLLAFTCCWPDLSTAVSIPQPGPGEGQDQPPAWPLILLPLETLRDVVEEAQVAACDQFRPVRSLLLVAVGALSLRQRAHCANGERRTQPPAGCVAVSPTHARHPTKLARIDGALVPLSPRSLPPASRTAGSFRSSAKAGDWRRMGFLLTDRSEVA